MWNMRVSHVRPTGVERTFGEDEIIVSKTDAKGIIRYANHVFCRVSGYTVPELLGQPHNIIRHADMPGGVFKLAWETIAGGSEIFAYVLNLASDGAHYWVLAHVTPSRDGSGRIVGYHSNRRLPDARQIDAIAPIYSALLAEERRHSQASAAVDAGTALLNQVLADLGQTYDEFVWSVGTTTPAMTGAAR